MSRTSETGSGNSHASGELSVVSSISRHRPLIFVTALVAAVVAVVVVSMRPSTFVAEADVLLENPRNATLSRAPSARDEVRYVADQVAIIKSPALLRRASDFTRTLGSPDGVSPQKLRAASTVRTTEGSSFVTIVVRGSSAETARGAADAIVRAYRELVRQTIDGETTETLRKLDLAIADEETRAGAAGGASTALKHLKSARADVVSDVRLAGDGVALVSPAEVGRGPTVSLISTVIAALLLGSLVGVGLAYVIDGRRHRLEHDPLVRAASGIPILGEIPDLQREGVQSKLPTLDAVTTDAAATFGSLTTIIAFRHGRRVSPFGGEGAPDPRLQARAGRAGVVVTRVPAKPDDLQVEAATPTPAGEAPGRLHTHVAFVSVVAGGGSTTIAANTAIAAAQCGDRVLLVDGDLAGRGVTRLVAETRRGRIELGRGASVGLSDMLLRGLVPDDIRSTIKMSGGGSLTLVEPSSTAPRASIQVRRQPVGSTLVPVREHFDWVVVDVPPVLESPVADGLLMSADAVVVVTPCSIDPAFLERALDHLHLLGVTPIGIVRNVVPRGAPARRAGVRALVERVGELTSRLARVTGRDAAPAGHIEAPASNGRPASRLKVPATPGDGRPSTSPGRSRRDRRRAIRAGARDVD